jgi:prepilin-type N-terminal cleavage/methylation domain-containing protein
MKLKFVRVQTTKSQAGFSMLESMIASMISLIFMSLGANLVLAANIQKIVAKRNIVMNNYVQSDLDGIKYQAKIMSKDDTKCNVTDRTTGYAAALKAQLGADNSASSTTSSSIKVMDRDYTMIRTLSYNTAAATDSRILKVAYRFTYGTDTTAQYQLYTEIMPSEASSCPSSLVP